MIAAHADVVGSLLRPPELRAAQAAFADGKLDAGGLRAAEDRAVDAAIALQEAAGLPVVTDGEQRRVSFQSAVPEALDGFAGLGLDAYVWGEWRGEGGELRIARPVDLAVVGKLRRRRWFVADEFDYLRARTGRVAKVALPSPSLFDGYWMPDRSRAAYATADAFLADLVDLYREEVAELARRGARYVQIDAPHYPLLLEPRWRDFYTRGDGDAGRWLDRALALDDAVMAGAPEIAFAVHVCRGNQSSRWLAEGDLEPLAPALFRGTRAQRLLLEYDSPRAGSFAALRHLPDDKMAILGLVTTKSGRRETTVELAARVAEAARLVARERLGLSPQCGFATSVRGNALTAEDQRAKLELVARAAAEIWPG
ncbi:MAG TPA: cobalamin-independent methionine synthase II family protein [Haliangiales bacterium]|nr:cobalamin-independent methionine synthase II family protein [Haliangiales bacterium]